MAEEYKWLFICEVPLLYEKRRLARQLKIETWLDLSQLLHELGLKQIKKDKTPSPRSLGYLV